MTEAPTGCDLRRAVDERRADHVLVGLVAGGRRGGTNVQVPAPASALSASTSVATAASRSSAELRGVLDLLQRDHVGAEPVDRLRRSWPAGGPGPRRRPAPRGRARRWGRCRCSTVTWLPARSLYQLHVPARRHEVLARGREVVRARSSRRSSRCRRPAPGRSVRVCGKVTGQRARAAVSWSVGWKLPGVVAVLEDDRLGEGDRGADADLVVLGQPRQRRVLGRGQVVRGRSRRRG